MMMPDALPWIKAFFRNTRLEQQAISFVIRMMGAFIIHLGRMSACEAASVIRTDTRHRASVTRFLVQSRLGNSGSDYRLLVNALLQTESRRRGKWLLIIDKTCCTQQGQKTENTFSTGNRKRRPRKGRRYNKKKYARRTCHGFVTGLLITPSGYRIPFHRCYYTREYCEKKKREHHTESELAAVLIRALPVPEGVDVMVTGDTAYDAHVVRQACEDRGFNWITPVNPERVLAGEKPRPKVRCLVSQMSVDQFTPVRLTPGKGDYVAQRRVARCRIGPKAKTRTFYVHRERLEVHSVGKVQVVFSTKEKPTPGKPIDLDKSKILMTNDMTLSVAEIVELYDLRWQIELFFKELKSTLGLHQYRFEKFEAVESWVETCLITFLYLEWYRAKKLQRRELSKEAKRWWSWQRTHGLCHAVRQETEEKELHRMAESTKTKTGLKKLKRQVRAARPKEYRIVA